MKNTLTTDSAARKAIPLARGLLDYFPNALALVAQLSLAANEKHNPGEEMHWAFGKSDDQADTIIRHLVDRGELDDDGFLHDVKVAWRGLALLETELIRRGAKPGRAVKIPPEGKPKYTRSEGIPKYTRSEVAWLVAKQLKTEGYDLNDPKVIEGPRAKELANAYSAEKAD